jgi:hypothetical protein
MISSGQLENGNQYVEDICVNYSSCFSLYFYDSYGDGICCGYGIGDFSVLNSSGAPLVVNNGEFDSEVVEVFCPDGSGCSIDASVNVYNASSENVYDGVITINTSSGVGPFEYSIDGGQTFVNSNSFTDLEPGVYVVVVQGASGICDYVESVTVAYCEFTSADIVAIDASSVVSTDGSIEITPTSGQGPYMYSIDGGQNFETTSLFTDLPVGPYNVVVQDESNICNYEEVVPIEVEAAGLNDADLINEIKLYPNPTNNDFTIAIASAYALTDAVEIQLYDNVGRTIQTGTISKNSTGKIKMSLGSCVSGTYFIKCFNNSSEKHFKVVKL